jgi:hypothetical protein
MPKTIKLLRLRASLDIYQNLAKFLEFIKDNGFDAISKGNRDWGRFETELKRRGIRGLDVGDIKSTFTQLDIIDGTHLSPFGEQLYTVRKDEEKLKELLATKMLREKDGWAYCHVLSIMSGRYRDEIAETYQEKYDPDMQEEYTDISKYNIFLEWLGVAKKTGSSYIFVQDKFEKLIGFKFKDVEIIDKNLSHNSKLCLLALIRLDSAQHKDYNGKEIRKTVLSLYGDKLSVHSMQLYATELKKIGFISYSHKGRGGDEFIRGSVGEWKLNRSNKELGRITSELLSKFFLFEASWSLMDVVNKPFKEILNDMGTNDIHKKGISLEQFASKICWVIGLRNIKIRVLEEGVELDITAHKIYPFFTRFLIQCKNHKTAVGVPVLAKELGIATVEKYNNVMVFSTSDFVSSMRPYVDKAMLSTGINIYLFGKEDIDNIANNPTAIYNIFERENKSVERIREGSEDYWSHFSE